MGMFDSIWVECPDCKERNEFQSNSGECFLHNYTLEDCPVLAIYGIHEDVVKCGNCGTMYKVDIETREVIKISEK